MALIPDNFPFPRSGHVEPFDSFASLTVANGVTATITTYNVPLQCKRGFVTLFGHGIDDPTAWAGSVWSIRRNGVNVRDYGTVQDQLGEFDRPEEIGPVDFKPGETITVVVTNNSGLAHLYAARIRGFVDNG